MEYVRLQRGLCSLRSWQRRINHKRYSNKYSIEAGLYRRTLNISQDGVLMETITDIYLNTATKFGLLILDCDGLGDGATFGNFKVY